MKTNKVSGRCLCGAVSFQLSELFQASAHCHCTYCQRAHGSAFVTWVVIPKTSFEYVSGEGSVSWYRSSEQSKRGFCKHCGSTMLFESALCPEEIHVTRANLVGNFNMKPMFHCFFEQKVDWITVSDDVPHLTSDSPELAHYKIIPPPKA